MYDYYIVFARLVLSIILFVAVIGKAFNFQQFVFSLKQGFRLSKRASTWLYFLVVITELIILGFFCVGNTMLPLAFGLSALVFLLFTLVLVAMLLTGRSFQCACFGVAEQNVNWGDVLRNLILVVMCLAAWQAEATLSLTLFEFVALSIVALNTALVLIEFNRIYPVLVWRGESG